MPRRLKIGDVVRLTRKEQPKGSRQLTRIRGVLPDIKGGVVLDDALEGSRCWNVEHLERVQHW